jgi:hypothetical protein
LNASERMIAAWMTRNRDEALRSLHQALRKSENGGQLFGAADAFERGLDRGDCPGDAGRTPRAKAMPGICRIR